MRHNGLRLSQRHRWWFYSASACLFLTGAAWLLLHWCASGGDEGATSPWEPWLMKLHGAAAMLVLVILGTLIPLHIRRGWHTGINRRTGVVVIALVAALVGTGYGLYYFGGEDARALTAYTHDAIGLASPLIIVWHVVRGRAARSGAIAPEQRAKIKE